MTEDSRRHEKNGPERLVSGEGGAPGSAPQKAGGSPQLIVGIGASAGGLEAFRTFFEKICPPIAAWLSRLCSRIGAPNNDRLISCLAQSGQKRREGNHTERWRGTFSAPGIAYGLQAPKGVWVKARENHEDIRHRHTHSRIHTSGYVCNHGRAPASTLRVPMQTANGMQR
jgi:hypothetical protein